MTRFSPRIQKLQDKIFWWRGFRKVGNNDNNNLCDWENLAITDINTDIIFYVQTTISQNPIIIYNYKSILHLPRKIFFSKKIISLNSLRKSFFHPSPKPSPNNKSPYPGLYPCSIIASFRNIYKCYLLS